ncbi:hypothetical protein COY33_00665 [candidate division WWE3 bacterium CG_4_10_14_0_2_um_filter_42_7]|uniref:Uncharacterized protein n=1 Tax=candidate division WWE3 bacterium CG_4_10_14_0_2_um_filter_42_7 TaxID=1975073 RepID=A0A2M7TEY7_UNCKA|nr:MAG: hypothetical protein COY33_00665 [candidate division WWE3 bacterium CG_4_10_14_0_2_um_filter_42_7]
MLLRRVLADAGTGTPERTIPNPATGITNLQDLFGTILNVLLYVGVGVCLIFLIMGGITYATSGGDPKAADKAKGSITSAIIGLLVIVGFRVIIGIILKLLGVGNIGPITG